VTPYATGCCGGRVHLNFGVGPQSTYVILPQGVACCIGSESLVVGFVSDTLGHGSAMCGQPASADKPDEAAYVELDLTTQILPRERALFEAELAVISATRPELTETQQKQLAMASVRAFTKRMDSLAALAALPGCPCAW
jgi:hypothetical protein